MPFSSSSTGSGSYVSQLDSGDTHSSPVFCEDTDYVASSADSDISDSESESTDFVLLGHPLVDAMSMPSALSSVACTESEGDFLSSAFEKLTVVSNALSDDYSSDSEDLEAVKRAKRAIKRRRQRAARKARRVAQTPQREQTPVSTYCEATAFISRYIACPHAQDGNTKLQLLRSLIIELGVRPPNSSDLPSTLTSARKLIKAEMHVNIKEYVATRDKGQLALKQIMHPSKSSLRREIQKTGQRASLKWVKKRGLQALLIHAFQ